jgi:hypothetical protein
MSDEERELIRQLQAKTDAYAKGEVELPLGDQPGLYRLPRCTTAGVIVRSPDTAELLLDIQDGQRILVEIGIEAFQALHGTMSFILEKWTRTTNDNEPSG